MNALLHGNISVEIFDTPDAVRAIWDDMLLSSNLSIYQTPEFLCSWAAEVGKTLKQRTVFMVYRQDDDPILILPLGVSSKGTVKIASLLGGKHANFNLPISRINHPIPDFAVLLPAMLGAAKKAGIDEFSFLNQPVNWLDIQNPLSSVGGADSPSFGYGLKLQSNAETVIESRLNKDARKNLRRKENNLGKMGNIEFIEARDSIIAAEQLEVYFRQKSTRFDAQGIADPFADPAVRNWLSLLAQTKMPDGHLALRLFGLKLNGEYISIWGVGTRENLISGMFTSFETTGDVAKISPGEILLVWLIRKFCSEGYQFFDFGVGEARYKSIWCDTTIALFDTHIGVSMSGRLLAKALIAKGRIKRKIKQSPRLMKLAQRLRKNLI